jgi:hypothetical protein
LAGAVVFEGCGFADGEGLFDGTGVAEGEGVGFGVTIGVAEGAGELTGTEALPFLIRKMEFPPETVWEYVIESE